MQFFLEEFYKNFNSTLFQINFQISSLNLPINSCIFSFNFINIIFLYHLFYFVRVFLFDNMFSHLFFFFSKIQYFYNTFFIFFFIKFVDLL